MAEIGGKEKSPRAIAREVARNIFRHENGVLITILIALIAIMGVVTKGLTVKRVNVLNILLQSSIRGLAAISQTLVILTAGIDISVGGVGLSCSMIGASLMTLDPERSMVSQPYSPLMAIPIMLLVGLGWGVINGLAVSRIGMPPLIVTLAMWQVSAGVAKLIGGGMSIWDQPESLAFLGEGTVAGIPVPGIIFITVAALGYFMLNHTTLGRSIYAVGGNPVSAWLTGIDVRRLLFTVYVIAGFMAGLAGVVMTARVMSASQQSLAGLELDSIAAATVGGVSLAGGKGTLIGAILGTFIIGVVNNGMSVLRLPLPAQDVIKGSILITAVAIDSWRRR